MQPELARRLRRESTDAEAFLWRILRNRQLSGHKFRRPQPIGPFIVDFCCLSARLVIEVDGGQHGANRLQDEQRTQWLVQQGYRVVRFCNHEVLENPAGVFSHLAQFLDARANDISLSPHPASPSKGEEPWARISTRLRCAR